MDRLPIAKVEISPMRVVGGLGRVFIVFIHSQSDRET